jgi:hypothetical protein
VTPQLNRTERDAVLSTCWRLAAVAMDGLLVAMVDAGDGPGSGFIPIGD